MGNYAKRRLGQLSYKEKMDIVENVLVKLASQKDTAHKFRVTPHLVYSLVLKTRKNKSFLKELREKEEVKEEKREKVADAAIQMIEAKKSILKTETIKAMVMKSSAYKVTNSFVR